MNIPTWTSYNCKGSRTFKSWRVQDESGKLVCTLPDDAEGHKNADLIAMAPAMLIALEMLLNQSASLDQSATKDGLANCETLKLAREIIAQAKGEQ